MSLTKQEVSALLKGAETTGESCLQLCQILADQGIDLANHSTRIKHVSLELQKLLNPSPALVPVGGTTSPILTTVKNKPQVLDSTGLIKPCILSPDDPRIAQISGLHTLQYLQQAVRSGTAREKFPVGTVIPDLWIDHQTNTIYLMPLIVVDYRTVELARSHQKRPAATLLRQNASPTKTMFDKNTNIFTKSSLNHWYNDEEGYLKDCSFNLLSVVAEIIIDDIPVKFFPPSLEELHFNPYDNPELENLVWEYFRDTPTNCGVRCAKRIFLDPSGTAQTCLLRSADRGLANYVWGVATDGSVLYSIAYFTRACAPACVIA